MNFLEKFFKGRQLLSKSHYRFGKNSTIDWLVIVALFIGLSVIFAALASYQFFNYQKSDLATERSVTATSTAVLFDRGKFDGLLESLAEREKKFNKIKSVPLRFVDPSR